MSVREILVERYEYQSKTEHNNRSFSIKGCSRSPREIFLPLKLIDSMRRAKRLMNC